MKLFWKIWLFGFPILASSTSSNISFLTNISSEFVPKDDKLAECLLVLFRDPKLHYMINVRIHIEAEYKFFRQKFEDTVRNFFASNDRVAIELNSDESTSYNIHVRIYFIDSMKSLKILEQLIKLQRKKDRDFSAANQNYLIILPTDIPNPERFMKEIFHMCWKNFIVNVNVLVENANGYVTLYTYYPFNAKRCEDSLPTVHNRFVNGSLEWIRPTFPPKAKNFWKCPLKAIVWNDFPFVVLDTKELWGIDGVILTTLAHEMNFSLEIIVSSGGKGVNYPNGSSSGAFKMLHNGMGDLTMGGISIIKMRHDFFAATSSYYASNIWVVIKRPREYSPIEILLFPFDLYTWLSVLTIIIGKWIGRVMWNRITTSVVPFWEYSMKIRLTAWLLTILILKSSYEGSIFKFLHNRPTKIPPNNLDEAVASGYNFFVWPQAFYFFSWIRELEGKMIEIDAPKSEVFEMFGRIEGKYGLLVWLDILPQYNNDPSKTEEYLVVNEPVLGVYPCVYLPKFSYLTRELNSRLGWMVTYGRVNKIIGDVASIDNFRKKKPVDRTPKQLSLSQLLGVFQVVGTLIAVSSCVFIIELLSTRNQMLKRVIEFLR